MTRRESLKQLAALAALGAAGGTAFGRTVKPHPLWLGVASYSLNKLTVDQVITALADLNIRDVSLHKAHCPWDGTPEQCRAVADKFRGAGVAVTGSGVIDLPNDETAVRKAFTNAKAAGLPTIVCTPATAAFPMVEKFVQEFDIRLAIHNHGPDNKTYPGPDEAWKAAEPFDKRIGLCIDVGHTFRAGQDPAAAIRKYHERLYHVHLKDLALENGKEVPCVVGSGHMDIKGIITALRDVDYEHPVDFEYEKSGGDHVEGLRQSLAFVRPLAD